MNNVNMVAVSGRLTKDSEVKANTNGKSILNFSLAVNERRKKGEDWEDYANFIRVVYWTNKADKMKESLTKGKAVTVAGSLRQNRWESKDGHYESEILIIASNIEYVPSGENKPTQQEVLGPESFNDDIPF